MNNLINNNNNVITNFDQSSYTLVDDTKLNICSDNDCSDINISKTTVKSRAIQIINLSDIELDLIFSNFNIDTICKLSKVCKKFYYANKYYLDDFREAHNLFLKYSSSTQEKIKELFSKEKYDKHFASWLTNFTNSKRVLQQLSKVKNHSIFYEVLFFYTAKNMQLFNNKIIDKFTSTKNDIAIFTGYSKCNTKLFIVYLSGIINIYSSDENNSFSIEAEFNLKQQIKFANLNQEAYTLVVANTNNQITTIHLTKDNHWQIVNYNDKFGILKADFIIFNTYKNYYVQIKNMLTFCRDRTNSANILRFYIFYEGRDINYWNSLFTKISPNTYTKITTAVVSYDGKYFATGTQNGYFIVEQMPQSYFSKGGPSNIHTKYNTSITNISFSINSRYVSCSTADKTTEIYTNYSSESEKIYTIKEKDNSNFNAHACFSNDSETILINHGTNIIILTNLYSTEYIKRLDYEIDNGLGKGCISNNSNYIAVYALQQSTIKLYNKNNTKQWVDMLNIDTKSSIETICFSTNEHHLLVVTTEEAKIYNLNCSNNESSTNISETNSSINKELPVYTISIPKNSSKHIILNPLFDQLLVAYNDIIKIFIPEKTGAWECKLTINTDFPIIKTVKYTDNGTHILVESTDNTSTNIKLLTIK